MALQPFSLAQVLSNAASIQGQRINNRLAQMELDPNSLNNQLKRAKIFELMNPDTSGDPTAPIRNFNFRNKLIEEGISDEDLAVYDNFVRAQQIRNVGGVDTIVGAGGFGNNPLSTLQAEAEAAARLRGAERRATLEQELELDPQIAAMTVTAQNEARLDPLTGDAAVESEKVTARETAKADVAEKVEQKRKDKAFNTYQVGRGRMQKALEGAVATGPIFGRGPALFAGDQVADNMRSIMLPILKSMVREAGEGIFTDKDAEQVLAMIPTRVASPEAVPEIFANMDAFVNAKLSQAPTEETDLWQFTDEQLRQMLNK